jgi:hypothetical protein
MARENDPVAAPVSLHNRRLAFAPVPTAAHAGGTLPDLVPLRFHATFDDGRRQPVDLESYPIPGIAAEAARVLWVETQPTGQYKSPGAVEDVVQALRRFAEMVAAGTSTPMPARLADVTAAHVDDLEVFLYARHGEQSSVPYKRLVAFTAFMRLVMRHGLAGAEVAERLLFVSRRGIVANKPREPYSPYVAEQLRQAAVTDMLAAVERITVEGARLLAQGRDPEHAGWNVPANLLWAMVHGGIETARNAPAHVAKKLMSYRAFSGSDYSFADLIRYAHLTQEDVLAFEIYLSLEIGLPIESVESLKENCLRNEARGYVTLLYVKRRRGASGHTLEKRIKMDEHLSPGAVVKIVKTLTARTRARLLGADAKWLFVGHGRAGQYGNRILRRLKSQSDTCRRFCERHTIIDDNGARLQTVTLARLRKTHKSERYLKHAGNLALAANDHTKRVHAKHYANIEALLPLHEKTIAEALEHALEVGMEPVVITGEVERGLEAGSAGALTAAGVTAEQAQAVAGGVHDVWLCSCLDHQNSPLQEAGSGPCRSPVWGCLQCRNAVIGASKLPALLAFLNHMLQRREQMDLDAWAVRYGAAHARITRNILPRFTAADIAAARAAVESEADLMWLPAELTHSR